MSAENLSPSLERLILNECNLTTEELNQVYVVIQFDKTGGIKLDYSKMRNKLLLNKVSDFINSKMPLYY